MNYYTETYELPCGYKTDEGFIYTHVEVREMTGNEEDILTDRKKLRNGSAINALLAACCKLTTEPDPDSGDKPEKPESASLVLNQNIAKSLTQGDRLTALLRIRQISYGNMYTFEYTCSECSKKNSFKVDLSTVELKKMENPSLRVYDVTLPRSKDVLTFQISTGVEEMKMQKMSEQSPGSEATINLAARLVSVNGDTVSPINYLKKLSVTDRQVYRDAVEKVEGGLDLTMEPECLGCGAVTKMEMPIQESFFSAKSE